MHCGISHLSGYVNPTLIHPDPALCGFAQSRGQILWLFLGPMPDTRLTQSLPRVGTVVMTTVSLISLSAICFKPYLVTCDHNRQNHTLSTLS